MFLISILLMFLISILLISTSKNEIQRPIGDFHCILGVMLSIPIIRGQLASKCLRALPIRLFLQTRRNDTEGSSLIDVRSTTI